MERLIPFGKIVSKSALEIQTSQIGIGFEKLDRNVFDPEKAYDKIAAIGVKWVRIQSGWQRTERQKGIYNFAWIDTIVDNLIARGMIPWICLCYGNDLYTEAAKTVFGAVGCPPIFTEEERIAWHNYVKATTKHFKGRVQYYEVWNEADGKHCWKHGVNAAEYGRFTKATAAAIREGDADAKVIGGVTCWINMPFIAEALANGMGESVDAISFHRYTADEYNAVRDVKALRALCNRYNPAIELIQGESGTQSSSKGAGALRGGAWTQLKQAKYLLRHRITDFLCGLKFTSHFTSVDMIEALNGTVGDKASYLDYGYFGVLSADFDENGFATGDYSPKLAYHALQNLCSIFAEEFSAIDLPIAFRPRDNSPRIFAPDFKEKSLMWAGFEKPNGAAAFAYWNSADLMTTNDFESTITLHVSDMKGDIHLIDMMDGSIYTLPESMLEKAGENTLILKHIPIKDYPLLLTFGNFAE